jgi:hypothetical protein
MAPIANEAQYGSARYSRLQDTVFVVVLLKQNEKLRYVAKCKRSRVSDVTSASSYAGFIDDLQSKDQQKISVQKNEGGRHV